jgi:succinyl-diaminopimelate desuccinylase
MSNTLQLTEQLIAEVSVTPEDANCQTLLAKRLDALGFQCENMPSGPENFRVQNLFALRPASGGQTPQAPVLLFAGHTDVVPTGPLKNWSSDPFTPSHRAGKLYGRGASDMKSSLAAMVVACEEFLASEPHPAFALSFLLTSDEEGPATDGTVVVCNTLKERGQRLDWCIVGEPTSIKVTGDMIKNGRRGTLSGKLVAKGVQGHIAYPQLAKNPIHLVTPALAELVAIEWDQGNAFFPPTTWQISNIHAGTGASNVIPGECVIDFNFRFCTESTVDSLQQRLKSVLDHHGIEYSLQWTLGGLPFITPPGEFVNLVQEAIKNINGQSAELSTTGGTSDGRFISQICKEVIELGPPNATIHKVDEHIELTELERLKDIYLQILKGLQSHLLKTRAPQQRPA